LDKGKTITATALINLVILITIIEGLCLFAYHRITGAGLAPDQYLLNLLAGLSLMLAIRSVSSASTFDLFTASLAHLLLPAGLLAAGLAHWSDIYQRWKKQRAKDSKTTAI
jgi:hypothetical protein